jgi:UDP-glucose 4-epimerase
MHIFITGGAGFIGSHIVESLLISGHWVTILDNLSSGVHGNVPNHPRITFIEKDLLSYAAAEWPRDLDAVIHLAALPSVTESWIELRRVHEINLSGTVHVLEGARHDHVPRFVFAVLPRFMGTRPPSRSGPSRSRLMDFRSRRASNMAE